jgi:hypothetical protein
MAGTLAMVLREFGKNRESGGEEEDDSDDRLRDGNKTIGEGNDDLWHDGDESSGMMRDESATAKSFVLLLSCSAVELVITWREKPQLTKHQPKCWM